MYGKFYWSNPFDFNPWKEDIRMSELRSWTKSEQTASQKAADAWDTYFGTEGKAEEALRLEEIARIAEVQEKRQAELLEMENVVGVATSLKVTKGQPTKEWSLTILVEKKLPKTQVPKSSLVPDKMENVVTDVLEVGKIEALTFDSRLRPALPGYSIGHYNITAGTFGCLVRDVRRCCCKLEKDCDCGHTSEECPGDYLILSNNHVLANVNKGKVGDPILQPGPYDGGVYPSDQIATLERFEPIALSLFDSPPGYNLVDAAVARPAHSRDVTASIIGIVMPRGVDQALVGDDVIKVGRTTQVTAGRVLATNATVIVGYGADGFGQFRHQILTTAMAAGGDSGSLLMNRTSLSAVGLLFAGSPVITIHNHIADVETALGVRPVTAPRFS
jgi:hypothetical protein